MRKKLLAFSFLIISGFGVSFAQCVINTSYTANGIYPDSATGLPHAVVSLAYNTTLQMKVLADTTVSPFGTIPVNYVKIDSIKGMPANFSYLPNPASGQFPGGSNACILLTGNPVAGQELAGPTSNGIYPLTVYYHANVQVPSVGAINSAATIKKYRIVIVPFVAGINELDMTGFTLSQNFPNPAGAYTEFHYSMPFNAEVEFCLYNMLGKVISTRTIHAERGLNKFGMETVDLSPGIYLYALKSGGKIISRRMIVSAR